MTGDTQNSSQPPGVGPGAVARPGPKAAIAQPGPPWEGAALTAPCRPAAQGASRPARGLVLRRLGWRSHECVRATKLEPRDGGTCGPAAGRGGGGGTAGESRARRPHGPYSAECQPNSDSPRTMQGLGVCGRGTQPGQSPAVPGGARPAACRGHTHVPEGAGPGSSALGLVRAGHKSGGWAPAWGKPGARTREGHVCTSRPPPARSSAPRSSSNAGAASFIISLGFLFKILRVSEIIQYLSLT